MCRKTRSACLFVKFRSLFTIRELTHEQYFFGNCFSGSDRMIRVNYIPILFIFVSQSFFENGRTNNYKYTMKKLLILCIAAIAMYACEGGTGGKNAFTIEGNTVPNDMNGKVILLQKLDEKTNSFETVDTAVIKDNVFRFKGVADTVGIGSLYIEDMFDIPVVFEPGKINVTISGEMVPSVSGTTLNDTLQSFFGRMNAIQEESKAVAMQYPRTELTPEQQKEFDAKMNEISERSDEVIISFLKANINNIAGKYFAVDFLPMFDPETQEELLSIADDTFKSNEKVQAVMAELDELKKAVGTPYKNFSSDTPEGKKQSLSDYAGKGKYVLVDFWASWCPPCRAEMPRLVALYDRFKTKDFEIVGVSLDNDKSKWTKALKDMNMTWPQFSDLKEWNSDAAKLYNVKSIPFTILIDKDGKIITQNISGVRLEKKLEELLK